MATEGFEGLLGETRNGGARAASWQPLGDESQIEVDGREIGQRTAGPSNG
jgi:hypothetical protein